MKVWVSSAQSPALGCQKGLEQKIGWEEPSAASDKQGERGWVSVFGTSWLLVGGRGGLSCLVLRYELDAPAILGHSNYQGATESLFSAVGSSNLSSREPIFRVSPVPMRRKAAETLGH